MPVTITYRVAVPLRQGTIDGASLSFAVAVHTLIAGRDIVVAVIPEGTSHANLASKVTVRATRDSNGNLAVTITPLAGPRAAYDAEHTAEALIAAATLARSAGQDPASITLSCRHTQDTVIVGEPVIGDVWYCRTCEADRTLVSVRYDD